MNKSQKKPTEVRRVAMESVSLDFSDSIPAMSFKEDKRLGIIKAGDDNAYFDFLEELVTDGSGKHSAIISKKTKMIAGNGFQNDRNGVLKDFIRNSNGNGTLTNIAKLVAMDLEVFNAFALIVRWNNDKTYISAIDHKSVKEVRKGIQEGVWKVSDDWKNPNKPESNTRSYREFTGKKGLPADFESLNDEEKEMQLVEVIYYKVAGIGSKHYGVPYYKPSIDWILTDKECGKYSFNNVNNNFVGGYHIDFISEVLPTNDERRDIKQKFKKEYTGAEAEKVIMTFSEAGSKTQITPLPTNGSEDAFMNTEMRAQENIFIIHEVVNPLLFGIRVPGQLGGGDELEESLSIFQSTYIDSKQEIIEDVLNMLARINGLVEELKLKPYVVTKPKQSI